MKPNYKKAFKGFKIDKKEIINQCLLRYIMRDLHNHIIEIRLYIPVPIASSKTDERHQAWYTKTTEFIESLGYWED